MTKAGSVRGGATGEVGRGLRCRVRDCPEREGMRDAREVGECGGELSRKLPLALIKTMRSSGLGGGRVQREERKRSTPKRCAAEAGEPAEQLRAGLDLPLSVRVAEAPVWTSVSLAAGSRNCFCLGSFTRCGPA